MDSFDKMMLAVIVLVPALIFGGAAVVTKAECRAQWEESGMPYRWGVLSGCMVQQKDRTWIPANSAVRYLKTDAQQ